MKKNTTVHSYRTVGSYRCKDYVIRFNALKTMTTQTLQKLNSPDLTDGNSVRSLFQELIQLIDIQKDEITELRTDYDELKNEKDELG